MDNFCVIFLASVLLISACIDLRIQKIPNLITYPAMVIAISYYGATRGVDGVIVSMSGVALGIGIFMVPYLIGGMGAGDAKLMGVVGAVLGTKGVLNAVLCTAMIGGIYALALIFIHRAHFRGFFKKQLTTFWTFILTRKYIPDPIQNSQNRPRLCYGLVIAIGTGLYMFLNQSGYQFL